MTNRNIEDIYPLSPMQAGMLFHALLAKGEALAKGEVYIEQTVASLRGELNVDAFRQAWQRVMDRNPILRTAFVWEGLEEPLQVVQRRLVLPLEVLDLRDLPEAERAERVEAYSRADRRRGFDLAQAPLLRLALLRTADEAWELVWTHHHTLLDGWSLPILLREVFASYDALSKGKPLALPATRPYRDYIRYLKELKAGDAEAFWRTALAGYAGPNALTVERQGTSAQGEETHAGERNRERELWLSAECTAALQILGRTRQLTVNLLAGAAWGLVLSRYSGSADVVFGSTVSGRPPALRGAEEMVGLFINTLPVRVQVDEDRPLGEWLAAFQAQQADLRQYEHTPLVQIQGWSDVPRDTPLFDTLMVFENYPTDKALAQQLSPKGSSELRLTAVKSLEQTNYPLTFVAGVGSTSAGPALMLKISYDPARFDDATIGRMLGHLQTLLEAMPQGLDRPVGALPFLTATERSQILAWNDTGRVMEGANRRISDLVAEQAQRTPAAPAVAWDGADGQPAELSYAGLDARANGVAGQLQAAGVQPSAIVALYMERSPELVIGLLAVMKAGGAYLPLDPAYPPERIAFMLADSGAGVVLTRPHLENALETAVARAGTRPAVLTLADAQLLPSAGSIACRATPEDPVYIIYTSGSTGTPKGVLVPHRALSNLAPAVAEAYLIGAGDRMLQFISPSFDAAGEQFWPPLISGATIVVPGEERDRLGQPLAKFCERHRITHVHMAAPVWHQWTDDLAASSRRLAFPLKTVVVGGEPPSPERIRAWNGLLPAPCRFINAYGPTEATVTATLYASSSDARQPQHLPIGKPIANVQVRVVDAQMRWLPQGAAGELLIGGAGLALGYLNRSELTEARFVALPADDPLGWRGDAREHAPRADMAAEQGRPSGRLMRFYRTGDLVRWLPDGSLAFAGRADDQVKIRGYRVEPGEIEAAIAELPGVAQVAVVGHQQPGVPTRLIAYIVPRDGPADTQALAGALATRLPDYMVPSAWVVLPELPLTPTGKLDRRRLPASESATGGAAERPMTADEELIAQLFAGLLGVEKVSVRDSFFALGGHSLLATRLASRIHEVFGLDVPLRALFENPTVEGIGRVVAAARGSVSTAGAPPIEPLARGADGLPVEPPPLSFGQQRLWFLDQLEQGPGGTRLLAYNTPAAVRLEGELDVAALRQALNEIVRRHEVLRTSFGTVGGEPVQVIAAEMPLELPLEDLSGIQDPAEREQEALRLAQVEIRRPFDLAQGPVLRGRLFRLDAIDHIAVITAHHIAADGWSLRVLIGELGTLYEHFRALNQPGFFEEPGLPATALPLPPLPIQYADYAAWQRRWLTDDRSASDRPSASPLQAQLAYWKEQLAGLPARLDLPTDRPRPAIQSSNGSTHVFRLPAELLTRLNNLARAEGATLYMVLLAAYQTLLSRYSGQADIAVGSVVASRSRPEIEGLIGFFVNTLVFRTKFDGDPTFREVLARAREAALGAFAHQDVPFEMLVDAVQPRRELSHTPLFQAALSLQQDLGQLATLPARDLSGLTLRSISLDRGTAQFDMLLSFTELAGEAGGGLGASWEYNTDLFDRATIERIALNLQTLLESATVDPDQKAARLPLLSKGEHDLVADAWNSTAVPFPDDTTIHALIAQWAERTPEATAAEFVDLTGSGALTSRLTYGELRARADRVAYYLHSLGVGPDTLVGLSVERSLDMVTGILGILGSGAAYLPIDPNYPADRLAFMIADSGIRVLLTQEAVLPRLPLSLGNAPGDLRTVCLDADWPTIAAKERSVLPAAGPDNLAYCIYTSGSTGRPKGTLLRHRGLCNLSDVQARAFDIRPGKRVLQFSPFSFDASVWETVMALRSGATLVLTRQETLASGSDLLRLLQEAHITTATLPPSLLAVLEPSALPELETVVAAGERCTNEIVLKWADGRRFFNAYGPTETTVCATMHPCDPAVEWPFGGPPIGTPIANLQCYVVDANFNFQPIGVPGELIVGGAGVAKGYLNRPELTGERFIQNPLGRAKPGFSDKRSVATRGEPLYRTGDLVRWLADGNLEFLGRLDDQVKVRGFRIELGEIESVLREHPGVRDAVVAARDDYLVGYIIPSAVHEPGEEDASGPASSELRAHLRGRLPEYMVPAVFVPVAAFPLSPAGKVDRTALRNSALPASQRDSGAQYVAPRNPIETSLAALCAELLEVERVGVDDNFFDLGGHSLLATRLIARIRDSHHVELPLRTLFEKPTIAGLAEAVEQAQAAPPAAAPPAPAITARSREGRRVSRNAIDGGSQGGGA